LAYLTWTCESIVGYVSGTSSLKECHSLRCPTRHITPEVGPALSFNRLAVLRRRLPSGGQLSLLAAGVVIFWTVLLATGVLLPMYTRRVKELT
jgi:hypothetical protein